MSPPIEATLGEIVASTGGVLQTGPFGSQLHATDYVAWGVPVIMPVNIGDNTIVENGIARVGFADARRLRRHALREGDIVFGRRGEVGRRSIVRSGQENWLCGTGCLAARLGPKRTNVAPAYVAHYVGSPQAQTWLVDHAVGATMPNLNTSILAALPVWWPPIREQEAIAEALDDATALVTTLERLITKKEAMKQGMMQELLTGRTRLPGFAGDWVSLHVAAASHLKARIGWQGLTTDEYRWSGEHRVVGGTDFVDGAIDWAHVAFVDKWRFDQDLNIQLSPGDVLLSKDGTIGKVAYVAELPGPATLNSGVFVIRPKPAAYVARFLFYVLRSRIFDQFVAGLSAGSTINHLYQRDLVTLSVPAPVELGEQHAIATVLGDADAELDALRARLDKARAVKQGMMQELLTGRTRLPVKEES